jgi:hypothetical protein
MGLAHISPARRDMILNEPFTNDYHDKASGGEKQQREAEITEFVRHDLSFVRQLDPVLCSAPFRDAAGCGRRRADL